MCADLEQGWKKGVFFPFPSPLPPFLCWSMALQSMEPAKQQMSPPSVRLDSSHTSVSWFVNSLALCPVSPIYVNCESSQQCWEHPWLCSSKDTDPPGSGGQRLQTLWLSWGLLLLLLWGILRHRNQLRNFPMVESLMSKHIFF